MLWLSLVLIMIVSTQYRTKDQCVRGCTLGVLLPVAVCKIHAVTATAGILAGNSCSSSLTVGWQQMDWLCVITLCDKYLLFADYSAFCLLNLLLVPVLMASNFFFRRTDAAAGQAGRDLDSSAEIIDDTPERGPLPASIKSFPKRTRDSGTLLLPFFVFTFCENVLKILS